MTSSNDVSHILFPSWRNSLEIPFLFVGDIHPYLFTNILDQFAHRCARTWLKKVQAAFVGRVAEKWGACEGKKIALEEAVKVLASSVGQVVSTSDRGLILL
ncbi:hypothetical protein CCACVL1_23009 [Corchorus capsularis]|uniref:DOG1 domain-containing protein n=1 Tax=Corchorus capsularis TaxID=210143 RepID=A0A1R3GVK5_COCAP|nr:hypothetical protein CCACVL1_23009 [Corchorus capsularis]